MKNIEIWSPSKYEYIKGKLKASRNPKEVGIASRLIVDLVAEFYEINIPKYATGKLIDLGCGKVPLFHVYSKYVDEVTCADWGNTFHKNPHLDIEQDLNEKLKIEDRSFDTVIFSDVLEHIREPKNLMIEISRILKPNGKLLMNVPYYYWLHEQPFDYFRYTEFALRYFAEQANLKIIKLQPYGGAIEILADILSKLMTNIPFIGRYLTMIIQKIAYLFTCTKIGKKILKKTSRSFPLGYVLILEK